MVRVIAEINSDAFYDQQTVSVLLQIPSRAIGNACRAGELRFTEKARRKYFRGSWIIAWLESSNEHESKERFENAVHQ